jgi:hypothetical protein
VKAVAALMALWLGGSAHAYILPSTSILRRMTEARDEMALAQLKLEGTVSFMGSAVAEAGEALGLPADRAEVQAEIAISVRLPGRCRLDIAVPETGKTLAVIIAAGKLRSEGIEIPSLNHALSHVCALLALRSSGRDESRAQVERTLNDLRVEWTINSLARFGGQVAYVLGELNDGKPQLWVYKDNFLPARMRFPEGANYWDVRFLDYSSPATGEWFPRVLEVHRGSEQVIRITTVRADSRTKLSDKLF